MVLKLYGSAMSTSRVLVTILELTLPYELIVVDISKGEQKTEGYMKMQPFGKVPALDDAGFVGFESRAICKYLCKKYQGEGRVLVPFGDEEAYARFEQACSVEQNYFAAAAETIGMEMYIKPAKNLGPPDLTIITLAETNLDTVLAYYDTLLSKQNYIAGNSLPLADLFHLPNGAALKAGKWRELFERYTNVDKWFAGLQERETWVRAAGEAVTVA